MRSRLPSARTPAMRRLGLGVVLLWASACGTAGVHQMSNGNLRVQCPSVQSECMRRAEIHCADQGGVHVVSSREKNDLRGVEGNMEGTLVSEVIFVCGDDAPRDPIKLPPRPEAVAPKAAREPPTKKICIPGTTQQCVGPGACVGGQACLPTGVAWGPCECAHSSRRPASDPATAAGGAGGAGDAP